jgi:3-hydroxyisobutyrate dehydrogenase
VSGKPAVAVLGTGTIGKPVARNLARAGFRVRAWNRTREHAAGLVDDGVSVAESPAEAVAEADVVITLLTDSRAVEDVMDGQGAAAAARAGATWIQSSTVGVSATERLARLADEHALVFVDAPVLGTREPAEKGELLVFASGTEAAKSTCEPVFGVIGKGTRWVGEVGLGTRFKLVVNAWLLALVEGAAEAIALARALGIDPNDFLQAVAGGPLDTPYLQLKGRMMIGRRFDPSFKASLAEKDARLVLEAGREAGLDLLLVEAVEKAYARAIELGHGDEDMAAVIEGIAEPAAARR